MLQNSVLIDRGRGLRSDVAVLALEVKSGDAIFALFALERDAALDLFGCVTSRNPQLIHIQIPGCRNTSEIFRACKVRILLQSFNVYFEAQSEKNQSNGSMPNLLPVNG